MRMTPIHAQTERERQDRFARRAEKRRCRSRRRRLRHLIRLVPAVCATAGAALGEKRLPGGQVPMIFECDNTPIW